MSNPYTEKAIAVDVLLVSLILLDAIGIIDIGWWIYVMLVGLSILLSGSRITYEKNVIRDIVEEIVDEQLD